MMVPTLTQVYVPWALTGWAAITETTTDKTLMPKMATTAVSADQRFKSDVDRYFMPICDGVVFANVFSSLSISDFVKNMHKIDSNLLCIILLKRKAI